MTAKELNKKLNRAPVDIVMTSGTVIHIAHREFVAVPPDVAETISCYDSQRLHHTIDVSAIADILKAPRQPK